MVLSEINYATSFDEINTIHMENCDVNGLDNITVYFAKLYSQITKKINNNVGIITNNPFLIQGGRKQIKLRRTNRMKKRTNKTYKRKQHGGNNGIQIFFMFLLFMSFVSGMNVMSDLELIEQLNTIIYNKHIHENYTGICAYNSLFFIGAITYNFFVKRYIGMYYASSHKNKQDKIDKKYESYYIPPSYVHISNIAQMGDEYENTLTTKITHKHVEHMKQLLSNWQYYVLYSYYYIDDILTNANVNVKQIPLNHTFKYETIKIDKYDKVNTNNSEYIAEIINTIKKTMYNHNKYDLNENTLITMLNISYPTYSHAVVIMMRDNELLLYDINRLSYLYREKYNTADYGSNYNELPFMRKVSGMYVSPINKYFNDSIFKNNALSIDIYLSHHVKINMTAKDASDLLDTLTTNDPIINKINDDLYGLEDNVILNPSNSDYIQNINGKVLTSNIEIKHVYLHFIKLCKHMYNKIPSKFQIAVEFIVQLLFFYFLFGIIRKNIG
jgi:hypothetical protein